MIRDEDSPKHALEMSVSFWLSCTLHAGVDLDVFSVLADDSFTAGEVAGKLGADPRGTTLLLNALTSLDLLHKDGDRYRNTAYSKRFLVKDSPRYVGYIIKHHHHLVRAWWELPQSVLSGKPVDTGPWDGEKRESFLMGMFVLAMGIAPLVAPVLDLSDRRHLLDMGGGPGTYAIHFCLAHPELRATVFDLPTTRPFAEQTIARFGLSDRIDFVGGDYTLQDIPGRYDAVWMSHILHSQSLDECRALLKKAAGVLEPGGLIFVQDFILNDDMHSPLHPALFALNMLVNTEGGRSYSDGEIRDMLADAGVKNIRRLDFRGSGDTGIITGTA